MRSANVVKPSKEFKKVEKLLSASKEEIENADKLLWSLSAKTDPESIMKRIRIEVTFGFCNLYIMYDVKELSETKHGLKNEQLSIFGVLLQVNRNKMNAAIKGNSKNVTIDDPFFMMADGKTLSVMTHILPNFGYEQRLKHLVVAFPKFDIKWTKEYGIGVYAKKDYAKNDIILSEKAFCYNVTNTEYCSYCTKKSKVSRCTKCKRSWYCSKGCQLAHWKAGHKVSCILFKETEVGLEFSHENLLAEFIGNAVMDMKKTGVMNLLFSQECIPICIESLYSQYAEVKKEGIPLLHYTRFLAKIRNNSFSLKQCNGLYQFGALINHDCSPNAVYIGTVDNYNTISYIATKKINKGDQIFMSYVPSEYRDMKRKRRLFQYGIVCKCKKCNPKKKKKKRKNKKK